jgi:hypothetical protein
MYEFLLVVAAVIAVGGAVIAYDGSRDVFHPLIFIGPMLAFLYAWMPFKMLQSGGLAKFFDGEQLLFVQTLYLCGVLAFVVMCLSVGVRLRGKKAEVTKLSKRVCQRLLLCAVLVGGVGLTCWIITIHNVGGFVNAFSASYGGGYDDSGYVRDGSLLLLVGVLLAITSLSSGGPKLTCIAVALMFGLPWASSALLMGRRGPTFALVVVLMMGWFVNRRKRPPLLAVAAGGLCLGWLVLFLVTNRSNIYIGSSFEMKTDVGNVVETADNSNEYIYGSGSVLSAKARDHYYWMRRYLAQIMVRPIPSAIWPTKYQDFGVPELLVNAGTGEGFGPTLGWVGAPGSAPGIIADLWVEVWWFAVPLMGLLGWSYGKVWKNAVLRGGPWSSQYVMISALSIYLVMQTGEAVIFRTIMLSLPCWLSWKWALKQPQRATRRPILFPRRVQKRAPHVAPGFSSALNTEPLRGTPHA